MAQAQEFKLVLVGDGDVGKTTLITRHRTGRFEQRYLPTLGAAVHPLEFNTNRGPVRFTVWDCAGQEELSGLKDGYYGGMDCAIVMFSVASKASYQSVGAWIQALRRIDPNVPIVLCGSKVDLADRRVRPREPSQTYGAARSGGFKYCDISAKSNYNFERPFLMHARHLLGEDIELV